MTVAVAAGDLPEAQRTRLSYRTPQHGHLVVVTTPDIDPGLWVRYLEGAQESYGAHGVTAALEVEEVADGRSTALLMVALAPDGRVLGGMRAQGPYAVAEEAQALSVWAGSPGQPGVRAMIEERLPHGIAESKGLWVARDVDGRAELVASFGRGPVHAATILGARYGLGITAVHTERLWTSSGAVVVRDLPAVDYPTERYRTRLIWWDRWSLPGWVTDEAKRALDAETAQLLGPFVPAARRAA